MKVLAVALLAPLLTVAACAAAPPATAPPLTVPVRSSATARDLRQGAQRQARALLSLVQLPSSARPRNGPPPSLGGPAMGVPGGGALADEPSFWRINLPADRTVAWIKAHPPLGSSLSGSGTVHTGAATVTGLSYQVPGTDPAQLSQVQIGVAADGPDASLVRADGLVIGHET